MLCWSRRLLVPKVFEKKFVPKAGIQTEAKQINKSMVRFLDSNTALLTFLTELDMCSRKPHHFDPTEFLNGVTQAYEAIAEPLSSTPPNWDQVADLLPQDLLTALKEHFENQPKTSHLPHGGDDIIPIISSVRYTKEPPMFFPNLFPYPSMLQFLWACITAREQTQTHWQAYLKECVDWYTTNQVLIDVLFYVRSKTTKKAIKSHHWTFQRETDGEWNVVGMDH
eukprot:NODE_4332_length_805_cov_17.249263_g4174_i0.p1 GENE.NODE_4332_length_805_cov_17.249263_g4174_i0~~NODE_4332_length_805_cov_17.249263_g4174_i0.p1  ORF type:complete len:239 (-),score=88.11 NODE_4332_length_805_cov_17.249263_g4174_i0:89-760(-)